MRSREGKEVTHIPCVYHSPAHGTTMASACICPALFIAISPGPPLSLATEKHVANQTDVLLGAVPPAQQQSRNPTLLLPAGKRWKRQRVGTPLLSPMLARHSRGHLSLEEA